jgi:hypothetical protein
LHGSIVFTIRAQRNNRKSERNMLLISFFGASVGLIRAWKNRKYICGVMSVLQSKGKVN